MHRKKIFGFDKIDKLSIVSLITSIGVALISTIWAIYLESFLHNPSYVGFVITFFTIVSILSYIFLIPIIEKNSKTKIFMFSLALYVLSYFLFSIISNLYAMIFLGALLAVVTSMKITSFGIIVGDKSNEKTLPKNISIVYTFMNISWVIGPILAGFFSERYGIKIVFVIAAALMFLALLFFKSFNIKDERSEKPDKNLFKAIKNYIRNRDRLINYIVSGGVSFWWTLIYVYMPIYIIESGMSKLLVGYFLSAVVIPLIIFEYLFGKLTVRVGFRKMFFTGYLILSVLVVVCFFFKGIYIILGILSIASIGMAMIEPTTEAYFFEIVKREKRDKYYGIYNTTIEVNTFLSSFLIAIFLLFLPFKAVFVIVGVVMFMFALISLKTKKVLHN